MRPGPLREVGRSPTRTARGIGRRRLIQALPAAAMLAAAPRARAATSGAALVVACDTTLGPVMRAAATAYANATGAQVFVFPTAAGLILPQLERNVQNDIVVTQAATMDAAVQSGVVADGAARGAWHNRLVIAAKHGTPYRSGDPIAAADPSPGSDMDGPVILTRLGLLSAATIGVIDTDAVAALVLAGTAHAGLMHMTDLRAHPELEVISEVSEDVEPAFVYAAAVTKLSRRPNPSDFVEFLTTSQGTTLLAANGLETRSS